MPFLDEAFAPAFVEDEPEDVLPALRVRRDEAVAEIPDRGCEDRRWTAAGDGGAALPAPPSVDGSIGPFLRLLPDDMVAVRVDDGALDRINKIPS